MVRRKRAEAKPRPVDWIISTSCTINGRNVEKGTELKIEGLRGRFSFVEKVDSPKGIWITVADPKTKGFRSFDIERVKTVHIKKKIRR